MVEYEDIEPNVWKPEKTGDQIEGVLINKKDNPKYEGRIYHIENESGRFVVFGTTVLDDRMSYVQIGERVRIEFRGKELNKKGQEVKIFRVGKEKKVW